MQFSFLVNCLFKDTGELGTTHTHTHTQTEMVHVEGSERGDGIFDEGTRSRNLSVCVFSAVVWRSEDTFPSGSAHSGSRPEPKPLDTANQTGT